SLCILATGFWLMVFDFGLWTLDFGLVQQTRVSPPHDFRHRGKIILAFDGFDFEAAIMRPVGPAIAETHERSDFERAADVRNIKALDARRRCRQAERLPQFDQILLR